MRNGLRYLLLLAIKLASRIFYRHRVRWLHELPPPPWDDLRVLVIINHTSLFEWLYVGELLGIGQTMAGRLLLYESLATSFHTVTVKADPACPLCGPQASIRDLESISYREDEPFCAA